MRNIKYIIPLLLFLSFSCGTQSHLNKITVSPNSSKIIAHRGYSSIAPENTLIAFQKAIDCGADYFELDVHKSKDGKPIVIHDSTIDRTSSNHKKGIVREMTYQALTGVNVGFSKKFGNKYDDEKIPTLKQALTLAKGKIKVCIEIKVHDVEQEVIQLVNSLNMQEEVIIFSFKFEVLTKIRQLDKKIPILYLIDYANESIIEYAKLINAQAIGVGYATQPTKELLTLAHQNGLEIWKWTINKEEDLKKWIDFGLDGIITNYPEMAMSFRK